MATENTQQVEQKVLTVPTGGDVKATQGEVDEIMDIAFPAYIKKQEESKSKDADKVEEKKEESVPENKEESKEVVDDQKSVEKKEEKKEEKREEKKEEKKTEPRFQDLSDEGINREVESLKTGKQETKERYGALLRELRAEKEAGNLTKREFEAAKKELEGTKKAQQESADKAKVPDDVLKQQQAEREELAMFRRQYQLDHDPKVKSDFDDKVDSVEQEISKTLTDAGVPEKAVALITKSGGWTAFTRSRTPMTWAVEDPETGEKVVKRGTQADYAKHIMENIETADASVLSSHVASQTLIKAQREQYVDSEKKRATEYFQTQEKNFKDRQTQQEAAVKQIRETYTKWADEIGNSTEFLKDETVPQGATAEQKTEIEQANSDRKVIRDYIKAQEKTPSMEAYQDLVIHAAKGMAAEQLTKAADSRIEELEKKLKEANDELVKTRNGGRSVPKSGSLSGAADKTQEPVKKKGEPTVDDILSDLDSFAAEKSR